MGEDCGEACCCAGPSPPPPSPFPPPPPSLTPALSSSRCSSPLAQILKTLDGQSPLSPPFYSRLLNLLLNHAQSYHQHLSLTLPPLTRISTNTPLFLACRSPSSAAAATARLLIIAGADVNSKSFGQSAEISHTETPLHAAAEACAPSRHAADAAPCENEAESGAVLEFNEVLEH
jgi:hypothetical protein